MSVRITLFVVVALLSTGCGLVDPLEIVDEVVGGPGGPDLEALLQCTPDDQQRVRAYLDCLERGRQALCAAEGLADDVCPLRRDEVEPQAVGCAPPTDIAVACAERVAPDGGLVAGPLDCAAANRAVAAAHASYEDDPTARLDAAWTVRATFAAGNSFGFIAHHGPVEDGACYVAFRGTDDVDDVGHDLRAVGMAPCGQLDGLCAEGFLASYGQAVASGIERATRALVDSGACTSLTVVGHSLGGAIADIFAAHLMRDDPATYAAPFLDVQTFGQPRVFEPRLADALHGAMPKTRWMRWSDPVVGLVPVQAMHHGTARMIREDFDWRSRALGWSFAVVGRDAGDGGVVAPHHFAANYRGALAFCR